MVSECSPCRKAAVSPDWPLFTSTCRGCQVRQLAAGYAYYESGKAGKLTPVYTEALRKLFGDEWKAAHEEVKACATRTKELRVLL